MTDINALIKKIKEYNPASDSGLILHAYDYACAAHAGQMRDSGEEYITHPLAVADILAGLQLDDNTIVAGLLHDVLEDTEVTFGKLEADFNPTIAMLVDGVTKLNRLEFHSRQEHQAENLRKMLLAMANDIRIVLIKLADRLHNMRTIRSHHSPLRQKEIAEETRTIFAPLAHRLGIFTIKSELEDLSLSILEPEKYQELLKQIANEAPEREKFINEMCGILKQELDKVGIPCEISGRSKSYYSIYNKMNRQQKSLSEIFDLNAVRVIVDSVRDCYAVLGVIHTLWKPIPGRFKDYIAMPKQNMYQSIHTTVINEAGNPFEVQIRTWEMHKTAEYGIAAHWRYKEGKSGDADFDKKVEWLRQILEWQQDLRDAQEFMDSVKLDLFNDTVYVFSPKGDIYELPRGAVPLDFAYRVHTQVGHQCIGAKVNKRLVPLDYNLKTGDIVEIITAKGRGPSRDWLNLVKTQQAKNRIRQWFKKEQKEDNIIFGKELLEAECKKYGYDHLQLLRQDKLIDVGKKFNLNNLDDLYAAVGDGALRAETVLSRLKEDYRKDKEQNAEIAIRPEKKDTQSSAVWVKGVDDVMVRLARCCRPLPGDSIIGYVTRGRGVSVHRQDCANIIHYHETEPDRLIEVGWGDRVEGIYQVELETIAIDRERLTMDIMSIMAETKTIVNGVHVAVDKKANMASIVLRLEVKTMDQVDYLMKRIMKVKNVLEVRRLLNQSSKKDMEEVYEKVKSEAGDKR